MAEKIEAAWHEESIDCAQEGLKALVRELEQDHPGAAGSLREGL